MSSVATDAPSPVIEIVFSAAGERTVFGTYGRMLEEQSWSGPSRDDIESSRIVCLDPFFGDASEQVAAWCRTDGVPYVTVDVSPDSMIASGAAAVVISEEYASRTIEATDPEDVLSEYLARCDGLVVYTQGDGPILSGRRDGARGRRGVVGVEARDTTGAGDAFRAGVVYGMLRGFDDDRTLATASALAAMVCRTAPGVLGSPTESELDRFLAATP